MIKSKTFPYRDTARAGKDYINGLIEMLGFTNGLYAFQRMHLNNIRTNSFLKADWYIVQQQQRAKDVIVNFLAEGKMKW